MNRQRVCATCFGCVGHGILLFLLLVCCKFEQHGGAKFKLKPLYDVGNRVVLPRVVKWGLRACRGSLFIVHLSDYIPVCGDVACCFCVAGRFVTYRVLCFFLWKALHSYHVRGYLCALVMFGLIKFLNGMIAAGVNGISDKMDRTPSIGNLKKIMQNLKQRTFVCNV